MRVLLLSSMMVLYAGARLAVSSLSPSMSLELHPRPVEPLHVLLAVSFGACIGYSANRLAIWLLFNPAEPIRIGRLTIQGIIPKKRAALASKLADIITSDILEETEVEALLRGAGEKAIRRALLKRLPIPPLPLRLAERLVEGASTALTQAAGELMVEVANALDLRRFIVEKVVSMDPRELNDIFHRAIGKELKWISLNDALLGAIMGLVESVLFALLGL